MCRNTNIRAPQEKLKEQWTAAHETWHVSDSLSRRKDAVRNKVFNFHSRRGVLIAKLKTKTSQTTASCKYKMDTGSDSNLMPVSMFKLLIPIAAIVELIKCIYKKDVLWANHKFFMPQ